MNYKTLVFNIFLLLKIFKFSINSKKIHNSESLNNLNKLKDNEYNNKCKISFEISPKITDLKNSLSLAQSTIVRLNSKQNDHEYKQINNKNYSYIKYPKSNNINKILDKNKLSKRDKNKVIKHIIKNITIMVQNKIKKERNNISTMNLLDTTNIISDTLYNDSKLNSEYLLKELMNNSKISNNNKTLIHNIIQILYNYDLEFKDNFNNKHTSDTPYLYLLILKDKLLLI